MSKISPDAMGITSAFFLFMIAEICVAFLRRIKKKNKKQTNKTKTSGTGNHHLKQSPAEAALCGHSDILRGWRVVGCHVSESESQGESKRNICSVTLSKSKHRALWGCLPAGKKLETVSKETASCSIPTVFMAKKTIQIRHSG